MQHLSAFDRHTFTLKRKGRRLGAVIVLAILTVAALQPRRVLAQEEPATRIQEITGRLEAGQLLLYQVSGLAPGDVLYAYVQGLSGSLDPAAGIVRPEVDIARGQAQFQAELAAMVQNGADPIVAAEQLREQYFLIFDDDGGQGYDAAFSFRAPDENDLVLMVGPALSSVGAAGGFGEFRLLLGVNTPAVLRNQGQPTGAPIATLADGATSVSESVELRTGSLTPERPSTFFLLENVSAGNTFYAHVATTEGDLRPSLELRDFGDKPVRTANTQGTASEGSLSYTFPEDAGGFRLIVSACCDRDAPLGSYRLSTGINAPGIISGVETGDKGSSVLEDPIAVDIGVRLEQITGIDQAAENYGVVAVVHMEWTAPNMAFNPDTCECRLKSFTVNSFGDFLREVDNRWPDFSIVNQQGNRWTQNRTIVVFPDGSAIYEERFSTTLQAPLFDFRKFPLDTQDFFLRIDAVFPEEFTFFVDREGFTVVGDQLGEEEWYITDWSTDVTGVSIAEGRIVSRYSFDFEARRHLSFYLIRLFVPILIIITVSWFTFFLKDYGKRVDIAAGNMLLFIAFNFTVSNDLPRLGYLTYLDTLLISTFVVTALVVIFNVLLKRLELTGRQALAARLDTPMIWLYPLLYIVGFALVTGFFIAEWSVA